MSPPGSPSPGSIGTKRPHAALSPTKASWIFSADSACSSGSQSLVHLKEPSSSAPLDVIARFEDRYAGVIGKVNTSLRKIKLPAADRAYLQRTIYRSLKANDTLASSARLLAQALRARDVSMLNRSVAQEHIAHKGLDSLSKQMTAYGANFCGWFFAPQSSSSNSKSNAAGGGVSA